jgi:hypothetical protein
MKFHNSFVTAGFAALALAGASVLGSAGSAQAFGLSFSPAGSNIDLDPIRDLIATPNTSVSFELLFDSGNLAATDQINTIVLDFGYDNMELLPEPAIAYGGTVTMSPTLSGFDPLAKAAAQNFDPGGSGTPVDISPVVTGPTYLTYQKSLTFTGLSLTGASPVKSLGKIFFQTGSSLPSDGKPDFFTLLTYVKGLNSVGSVNNFIVSDIAGGNIPQISKLVEIQEAKKVPTPALLPGLAAFGMSLVRKRKQEQAA